jgi:toxin ParE1/3/4
LQHAILFGPKAQLHLSQLQSFVATRSGAPRANRFVGEIITYCLGLSTFPMRGTLREDIRPGLRLVGFRRRVTIAFHVTDTEVIILGVFYGGQDVETILRDDEV